jgi:hypothetical protein
VPVGADVPLAVFVTGTVGLMLVERPVPEEMMAARLVSMTSVGDAVAEELGLVMGALELETEEMELDEDAAAEEMGKEKEVVGAARAVVLVCGKMPVALVGAEAAVVLEANTVTVMVLVKSMVVVTKDVLGVQLEVLA